MPRRWLLAGLAVSCAVAAALQFRPSPPTSPPDDGILPPREARDLLADRLASVAPEGPEAAHLSRQLRKLRAKQARRTATAENPGAFLEALAQIRTAPDGTTYPSGYRQRALERAPRRKTSRLEYTWVERGPGNISGRARVVRVDPSDPTHNTWFAATIGGGIWKTTNRGQTWVDKTPDLATLSTTTLAICESDPDVMYAGTGMGYGRVVDLAGSGVWKSVDHGETWFQLASTANGELLEAVNRIVVDPDDPDLVLVCSNDGFSHLGPKGGERISGIFRSTDGGTTWTQVFDPDAVLGTTTDNRVQQLLPKPGDFDVIYGTVNEVGVIKSTDAGLTWSVVTPGNTFSMSGDIGRPSGNGFGLAGISVRTEIAIAPTEPDRIYAAVERPRGVADLYMSRDAGATWSLINDTGPDPNWFNAFGASGAVSYQAGWFDNTIAVHPYNPDVVFVGGVNLFRLTVDPNTNTRGSQAIAWWIPVGLPVVHADHHWLEMVPVSPPNQFWILGANDGGVAFTVNGGASIPSWTTTTGMVTTQFYGADKKPGEDVYIGGMQDNGTWFGAGSASANWTFAIGGDGFEAVWHAEDPQLLLGGSQFNGLARSADGGATWQAVSGATTTQNSPFITKIANSKVDPDLVFTVDDNGVNRSDDFGLTWTQTRLPQRWLGYRPFDNVEISNADPQVVWLTSRMDVDPPSGQRGGVHVSTDGGLSFTHISASLPYQLTESSGIGTHPTDPATAYLLYAAPGLPKVMRTTDTGQTWEDLSGFGIPAKTGSNGFPDVAVFTLLQMPFDPDILWAGTEIGLFVSENGGQTWAFADDGLPHVAIFELSIVDDQVLAATQGRGVWTATLAELAEWSPPAAVRAPRLRPPALLPSGMLGIELDLRSAYDQTVVEVDGEVFQTLPANEGPESVMLSVPVTEVATVSVRAVSTVGERSFATPTRSAEVFPTSPVDEFASPLDTAVDGNEFLRSGFSIQLPPGFESPALHTSHPYGTQTDLTAVLKTPIRVKAAGAIVSFREIVLVEEGVVSDWTDANFFDYVVVEGTRNGIDWIPVVDGYDSRAQPAWLAHYRSGLDNAGDSQSAGEPSLYVEREIDLLETFAPGDEIFLRFRLHSDPLAVAWGWAIDDLEVQVASVGLPGDDTPPAIGPPAEVALRPNQPNPFNPSTTIRFELPERGVAELTVLDLRGRRVATLASGIHGAGVHRVVWDGTDDRGAGVASGVYAYRLRTEQRVLTRTLTLLK